MEIESNSSIIIEFTQQLTADSNDRQNQNNYFGKHWQVIQTSIKFFILQKASVKIVAFKKSLDLLVLHNHSLKIREALKNLWNEIFTEILASIQKNESNPLISLIQHYKNIESRLKIIFTILKSFLDTQTNKKIDGLDQFGKLVIHKRQSVQNEAYDILCRLIIESDHKQTYLKEMILLIEAFRNSSYSNQNIISEETCKNEVRIDLLILKKIGLFRHLEEEFDETSKEFYVQLSEEIPKNQNFLFIVNEYLEREVDLNKIFQPKKNTVYYVQKELIREYYDFILNELFEEMIHKKQKKGLEILWSFTLKLKQGAIKAFCEKLKEIIKKVKNYFVKTSPKQEIFRMIEYQQNLYTLTEECFQKNRKITNLIYHTFEQVLYEEQKDFLNVALKNILQEAQVPNQTKMVLQGEQERKISSGFQNTNYFKLFRIAPSKENFIKEFEVRFSRWILNKGFELNTLRLQQQMVQQMKKQVGNNLMKRLDKMLNDVYRSDRMYYHQQKMATGTQMKCMFLSSNWPVQLSIVFNIPDELYNMQNDFQTEFKKQIENKEKAFKWVSQMGTVCLAIHGLESLFSELEASIIILLDKSIRPLKKQQIDASLNIRKISQSAQSFSSQDYLSQILSNLVKNNILTFNQGPDTYDINDDNKRPYKLQRTSDENEIQTTRKVDVQKDNSILIEAAIMKILKRRKNMQRSDITKFIEESVKNFRPTFEQITKALQKLQNSQDIDINREKGIISYIE